jgi:hypothetical protein
MTAPAPLSAAQLRVLRLIAAEPRGLPEETVYETCGRGARLSVSTLIERGLLELDWGRGPLRVRVSRWGRHALSRLRQGDQG